MRGVPIMTGATSDEYRFLLLLRDIEFHRLDEHDLREALLPLYLDRVDDVMVHYARAMPSASAADRYCAILTEMLRMPGIRLAERQLLANEDRVYQYLFTWPSPIPVPGGVLGAAHGVEVALTMDNVGGGPLTEGMYGDAPPITLAAQMSAAWAAFAHDGDPSHSALPKWPSYSLDERATMIFDDECTVENDPLSAERELWESILP
jgi:para-nitrobenzyl esterase